MSDGDSITLVAEPRYDDSRYENTPGFEIVAVGESAAGSHGSIRALSTTPGASGSTGHDGGGSIGPGLSKSNADGNGPIARSNSLTDILPRDSSTSGSGRIGRHLSSASETRSVGPIPTHGIPTQYSGDYMSLRGIPRRSPSTTSMCSSGMSGEYDVNEIVSMTDASSIQSTTSRRTTNSSLSSLPVMQRRDGRKEEVACTVFCSVPNRRLFCGLCNKVYKEPVITTCGHSFCRRCCTSSSNQKCPVDGYQINVVVSNLTVSDQVGELLIHCKYGCQLVEGSADEWEVKPDGCPTTIKLTQRRLHEQNCEYALVPCPNGPTCPKVMRKHLEDHLRVCEHVACPHNKYKCPFRGTREQLHEHLKSCQFEQFKEILNEFEEKISKLQKQVKQKDEEISFLRTMLANVSDRLNMLEKNYEFRMERLDENQAKLGREVTEYKNQIMLMSSEIQQIATKAGFARQVPHIKCVGTFVGHDGPIWSLCTHGDFVYSGSSDNTIKVWGPIPTVCDLNSSYRCQRTLQGHSGIVLALATWNNHLYSGGADNTIRVWRIETLSLEATLHAHENPVCTLATSRGILFSGSLKTIKVWDTTQHTVIRELTGQNHWVRALIATDRYLYAGSYQSIKVWDLDTFDTVHVVNVTGGSVYSLQITSSLLICGTYENSIHVWSLDNFEQKQTLTGHAGTVYSLIVINSQGQPRLFSASYDHSIKVWSLESMTCLQTLSRHQGSVSCLATMHDRLYSGAVDHQVKVWQ